MNNFKGKNIDELLVTLPLADGSEMECCVYKAFEIDTKTYFALQPLGPDQKPDPAQGLLLYLVEEDAEGNPIILYIEDDAEYERAARRLQALLLS